MACIRGEFGQRVGPLVKIGISGVGTAPSVSPHKVATAWALIDTGAERSSILSTMAEEAGIYPFQKQRMRSASGVTLASIYLVNLQVHLSEIVSFYGCEVAEFSSHGEPSFRALLGRDILCKGTFSMANGVYELCL